MNKEELFTFRDGKSDDFGFIISSWLKSLYYGNTWYSLMPKDVFMNNYRLIISSLLLSSNIHIRIACLKETPDIILGYSVTNTADDVIHFAYIKKDFRKIGLAKGLTPESVKSCTHITTGGLAIMKTKGWEFNPFLI